jgi:hypothetical protein
MKHIVDPRQIPLFDPYAPILSPLAYQVIRTGWQGVFRHVILELLPAHELGSHFSTHLGRPTKELYSMAGLILIMEFKDWTRADAAAAYMFNTDLQCALNLAPERQSLCERTIERYERIFRDDDLAGDIMHQVTVRLAEALELDISQQRLDSTHVFSNMASFGRTRLMGVANKRFLTQVKRHAPDAFAQLPETLRQRYAPSEHKLFGDTKDAAGRQRARQQVAEDMYLLIEQFANDAGMTQRSSYQSLVLIFQQQCVVEDGQIHLQARTGGDCVQNPSDPDATYDGKKGSGYKVQLSETCHPDNDVQLITAALPQTAVESDAKAVTPILDDLEANQLLPAEMPADTAYGSDENVQAAAARGVELLSPVSGPEVDPHVLNVDDFPVNEATKEVKCCPAGHEPVASAYDPDTGTTTVAMPAATCAGCPFQQECPAGPKHRLNYTDKDRRLAERRREEATDAFADRYAVRAGIESTNSGLKRRLGLGQLRVRGSPSVFQTILLKVTGWNVLRAAASAKMRALVARKMAERRPGGCWLQETSLWRAVRYRRGARAPHAAWWAGTRSSPQFQQAA